MNIVDFLAVDTMFSALPLPFYTPLAFGDRYCLTDTWARRKGGCRNVWGIQSFVKEKSKRS